MDFLCDPENKKELFAFIASRVAELTIQLGKAVYITSGRDVMTVEPGHPSTLECSHEEADTRIVVHIVHALQQGIKKIEIRTVDTRYCRSCWSIFQISHGLSTPGYLGCFWKRKEIQVLQY